MRASGAARASHESAFTASDRAAGGSFGWSAQASHAAVEWNVARYLRVLDPEVRVASGGDGAAGAVGKLKLNED